MDYRLVKQFSNNSIDSFFNFFYKIADFFKVLVDLFWAFVDIWYQFFMIFINAWLYVYYFFLYIVDLVTISGLFQHKASARSAIPGSKVYRPDIVVPIHPRYGKVEIPKPAVAVSVPQPAKIFEKKRDARSRKGGSAREMFHSIAVAFRGMIRSIKKLFGNTAIQLENKFKPVREEEGTSGLAKKSLIEEYMKEYERKRKR